MGLLFCLCCCIVFLLHHLICLSCSGVITGSLDSTLSTLHCILTCRQLRGNEVTIPCFKSTFLQTCCFATIQFGAACLSQLIVLIFLSVWVCLKLRLLNALFDLLLGPDILHDTYLVMGSFREILTFVHHITSRLWVILKCLSYPHVCYLSSVLHQVFVYWRKHCKCCATGL